MSIYRHKELSDDTLEAIHSVLHDSFPPTNPLLLTRVANEWCREYGADIIFKQIIGRINEVCSVKTYDIDEYRDARELFSARYMPATNQNTARFVKVGQS